MQCNTSAPPPVPTSRLAFVLPSRLSPVIKNDTQSDAFQDDLFPPCFSGQPSHNAEEWQRGSEKAPMKMDMRPRSLGVATDPAAAAALAAKKKKAFAPLKSSKDLQKDVS